jgi:hypothetical protein
MKNVYELLGDSMQVNNLTIETMRYALDKMQDKGVNPFNPIRISELANGRGTFIITPIKEEK